MTVELDPAHVTWCKWLWGMLADDGTWVIPRSLSMLKKTDGKLLFIGASDDEFEAVRAHFAAIGIQVERKGE